MIVSVSQLSYSYPGSSRPACSVPELEIDSPGLVAITGESGAGKSTFVELLAGTLRGDYQGSIRVFGQELRSLRGDRDRQRYLRSIGLVPQDFALLPGVTVSALLRQDLRDAEVPESEHEQRIQAALAQVGLASFTDSMSHQLSGGQRQRVAVARVLARDCSLIVADEPTANLDPDNRLAILDLLKLLARNRVVLLITHDAAIAHECDRQVVLRAPSGAEQQPGRSNIPKFASISLGVILALALAGGAYFAWTAPTKSMADRVAKSGTLPSAAPSPSAPAITLDAAEEDAASRGYVANCDSKFWVQGASINAIKCGLANSNGFRILFYSSSGFVGFDVPDADRSARIIRRTDTSITVEYDLFNPTDAMCCPTAGKAKVVFNLQRGPQGIFLASDTPLPAGRE